MEQSSSQPPKFYLDKNDTPRGRNGDSGPDAVKDPSSQRMVADQLMAALASGNLEHLADARQAFLNEGHAGSPQSAANLEAQPERRSRARGFEHVSAANEELRAEEEALRHADLELERRRAEVQAAKRRAEADARQKIAEASR